MPSRSSTNANAAMAGLPMPGKGKFGPDLLPRALSAVILAPLVLFILWTGCWALYALVGLALLIGLYEWVTISRSVPWIAALGLPYLSLSLVGLWQLQQMEQARELVLCLFLMVWAVDIGAYFAGRMIGGPKLAPKLSPSKTWAGLLGGMAASAVVGYLWASVAGALYPEAALLIGAVVGVVAQIGDLGESMLKRRFGVKDSGHIIPGHGGILDRIDGLLLALPVFALFQATLGRSLGWW